MSTMKHMNRVKHLAAAVGGGAGVVYGLMAVAMVYRAAPFDLQVMIVAGVAAVWGLAGWLVGWAVEALRRFGRRDARARA
jgi:hypothetical protein